MTSLLFSFPLLLLLLLAAGAVVVLADAESGARDVFVMAEGTEVPQVADSVSYPFFQSLLRTPVDSPELVNSTWATIRGGADVKPLNPERVEYSELRGASAYLIFASLGHVKTLKRLVELGADPCVKADLKGFLMLSSMNAAHMVALGGAGAEAVDTVERLCPGLSRLFSLEGFDALAVAAEIGHERTVRALIPHSVFSQDERAKVSVYPAHPLHIAAHSGRPGAVRAILAGKPKVDVNLKSYQGIGDTALHAAAMGGHEDVVDVLLDAGADIKAKSKDGKLPADLAFNNNHHSVVELLRDHGAPPPVKDDDKWGDQEKAEFLKKHPEMRQSGQINQHHIYDPLKQDL